MRRYLRFMRPRIGCLNWPTAFLWCMEVYESRGVPWFLDHQAARKDSGRPRSSMRFEDCYGNASLGLLRRPLVGAQGVADDALVSPPDGGLWTGRKVACWTPGGSVAP